MSVCQEEYYKLDSEYSYDPCTYRAKMKKHVKIKTSKTLRCFILQLILIFVVLLPVQQYFFVFHSFLGVP